MSHRVDYRDIIAGALLIVLGLFAGFYATANYNLGTLRHMGPGMFPSWLGFMLAGLGFFVLVPALFRAGTLPKPDIRQFIAVLAGTLIFALTINVLGMVPAIFLLTIASVLADDKLGVVGTLVLCVVLSVLAVLIFRVGLEIPLYPFIWPF